MSKQLVSTVHAKTAACRLLACALAVQTVWTPALAQQTPAAPGATAATAQTTGSETGETVSLNFNNVDIDAVVRAIGKISGKNFIVDPRVKGTLNIVTNQPVPRAMTYSILLSALRLQGYAAVEGNGVVKIVPEADAKLHAVPVGKDRANTATTGDRLVTEVFQIRNESAAQLVQVVRPLVTPNNTVSVYPGNNTLVVTDYAENIARIAKIIASIDVPQGDAQLLPLRNASAVDLANTLNRLFNDGGQSADASQKMTILADSRSNSLLIRSENRSRLQAARSMASQMDQPGMGGNVRVIYLKNADATKVAATLRAAISGESSGSVNGGSNSTTSNNTNNQNQNQTNTANTTTTNNSSGSNISGGNGVFADAANNALIITAPDSVYNNLRGVIEQLDRRPAQVYVEALIAEVSSDRAAEIGIQWQTGIPSDGGTTVWGGTNFGSGGQNIIQLSKDPTQASNGLNFIVGSGPVTVAGVTLFNLNLLARFLETDTNSNILSTPSLVTVDNQEAKIVVGKNVPYVTGQYTNTGSGSTSVNPFQTIEYKDVGLTLKIKPQITEGGSIRMEIYQEASSILTTTSVGPTTSKRSVQSVVIADDGSIVALGGLVEDSYADGRDKVPLLGDLPYLGSLFRYDTRQRNKTNLLIFLRPKIIRTAEDAKAITQSRYDYIVGKQQTLDSKDRLMRGEDSPERMPPASNLGAPAIAPAIVPTDQPAAPTPAPTPVN
ncbi:type II secretion system secretin GspD [Uliginosibacterium sp. sgz301328]|uniref:type II secretion system secretin GspD n=1 Tax=Uliginosibacterium sp. sgz301328 TaxID=3243764 RepID=UPI00359E30DA